MTTAEHIAQNIYSTFNRARTRGRHGDTSLPDITKNLVKRTARIPSIDITAEDVDAGLLYDVLEAYHEKPGTPPHPGAEDITFSL